MPDFVSVTAPGGSVFSVPRAYTVPDTNAVGGDVGAITAGMQEAGATDVPDGSSTPNQNKPLTSDGSGTPNFGLPNPSSSSPALHFQVNQHPNDPSQDAVLIAHHPTQGPVQLTGDTTNAQGFGLPTVASTNPSHPVNAGSVPAVTSAPTSTPPSPSGANVVSTSTSQLGQTSSSINTFLRKSGQTLDATNSNWCAAFVNGVLEQNGIQGAQGTGKYVASTFLNWGNPVNGAPQAGDVLVQPRGHPAGGIGGHVGIATGNTRTGPDGQLQYEMVSGNYNKQVAPSWEPASTVVARRAPELSGGGNTAVASSAAPTNTAPVGSVNPQNWSGSQLPTGQGSTFGMPPPAGAQFNFAAIPGLSSGAGQATGQGNSLADMFLNTAQAYNRSVGA